MTTEREDEVVEMAKRFHEAYERLAPSFGYITNEATRKWDPESANGRLTIMVCFEFADTIAALKAKCVELEGLLDDFCNAFENYGQTTSLHDWNKNMRLCHENARAALPQPSDTQREG